MPTNISKRLGFQSAQSYCEFRTRAQGAVEESYVVVIVGMMAHASSLVLSS